MNQTPVPPFYRRWWRRLYWLRRDWRNLRMLSQGGPLVFSGFGGIGDELLTTGVIRALVARDGKPVRVFGRHPELFALNPDVRSFAVAPANLRASAANWEIPLLRPCEWQVDLTLDRQASPRHHIIAEAALAVGFAGSLELRPRLILTPDELAAGKIAAGPQVVVQSSGSGAMFFFRNKEWGANNFQEVANALAGRYAIIQLGSAADQPIAGAIDLRGKCGLRESAAVLARSEFLVCQVGLLMHLARAVDCRSVVVFGGRELDWQSGYPCNENVGNRPPCSPCWQKNLCEFERKCLTAISVGDMLAAVGRLEQRLGGPLETTETRLG